MMRTLRPLAVLGLVLTLGACTDMDALDAAHSDTADSARPLGDPVASSQPDAQWEFVVRAGGARVDPFPAGVVAPDVLRGDQVLRLSAVDTSVATFTDRPRRLAGELRPEELLALWHVGSFGQDPPNAAVLLGDDVVSVELRGAVYDPATATIVFVVGRLATVDGGPAPLLPDGDLGPVAVFVDGAGALDPQVTDPVTTPNVAVLGEAPAAAMSSLYQTVAASTGVAFQSATSSDSDASALGAEQGVTDQQVATLYAVDTASTASSTAAVAAQDPDLPAILAVVQQLAATQPTG